jgi:hypothetical protein
MEHLLRPIVHKDQISRVREERLKALKTALQGIALFMCRDHHGNRPV